MDHPCPSPPYRIDFAKNRKKSESTQNGLKRREIEKKIAPWWLPPRKKLRKIFKNFFENFLKVVQNHLNREKNAKNFWNFFSVITKKNLEKFSIFFLKWKIFFEFFSCFRWFWTTFKKFLKKNFWNFFKFFLVITEKNFFSRFSIFSTFQMILNNFQKIFEKKFWKFF